MKMSRPKKDTVNGDYATATDTRGGGGNHGTAAAVIGGGNHGTAAAVIGGGSHGTADAVIGGGSHGTALTAQTERRRRATKQTTRTCNLLVRMISTSLTGRVTPQNLCKTRVPQNVQAIYNKSVIKIIFFR
jgi:hypothetical protein